MNKTDFFYRNSPKFNEYLYVHLFWLVINSFNYNFISIIYLSPTQYLIDLSLQGLKFRTNKFYSKINI